MHTYICTYINIRGIKHINNNYLSRRICLNIWGERYAHAHARGGGWGGWGGEKEGTFYLVQNLLQFSSYQKYFF